MHRGRFVIVRACLSEICGVRVGYTASRRVGGAVDRNFCKRRMRHLVLIHRFCEQFSLKGDLGVDYVFIAQQSMINAGWVDLCQDFESSVRAAKAKLLRSTSNLTSQKMDFPHIA